MDPSSMYQQHDWSSQTWGLMLAAMIVLVGAAVLVAFALMMRVDARSGAPDGGAEATQPTPPTPATGPASAPGTTSALPDGEEAEGSRPLAAVH